MLHCNRLGLLVLFLTVIVVPVFAQVPSAPANLTVQLTMMGGAILHWDSSATALSYKVYKSTDGMPFVEIATVQHTIFYDWKTYPGNAYSYFVRAFNLSGGSLSSDTVRFQPGPPPPPPVFGVVKGSVTDDSTGLPLRGAVVHFYRISGFWHDRYTRTDSNGMYRILLDTGNFVSRAEKFGYLPEWYNNVHRPDSATIIQVIADDSVTVNFSLQPIPFPVFATVSGTVTDSTTGLPLRGADVVFLRPYHDFRLLEDVTELFGGFPEEHFEHPEIGELRGVVWVARTDSLGNYIAHLLADHRYIAVALKAGYRFKFYDNKKNPFDADRIFVAHDTTGIDFALVPGLVIGSGSFSGTVVDSSGSGIPSHVVLFRLTPFGPLATRYRMTDSLGAYAFRNLVPGKFFVRAVPVDSYAPAWYKEGYCGVSNWHNADTVFVQDSLTTPINICVVPSPEAGFARISGQIIISSNLAAVNTMQGVSVYAVSNSTNDVVGYDITESDGSYAIENLIPGTYHIEVDKEGYTATTTPTVNSNESNNYNGVTTPIAMMPDSPTEVKGGKNTTPEGFSLEQNYPNPFNPSTDIRFELPKATSVTLTVYNLLGQEIIVLTKNTLQAGSYDVRWSGVDSRGTQVSSGIYFVKMEVSSTDGTEAFFTQTRKLILMK